MKKIFFYTVLTSSFLLNALQFIHAQHTSYSQIRIQLSDEIDLYLLQHLNLDIDHPKIDKSNRISFFAQPAHLDGLRSEGVNFEILIDDYETYYADLLKNDIKNQETQNNTRNPASHFGYGSMGGFYTLNELEGKLDEMSIDFPNLASSKFSIGTSVEGRTIWAIKISDNPNVDENESAVYYDALHHCREPLSMAVCVNYMFWLLENYAIDPAVQYIVNNRELYFVPCVNPDGYEYNRQTNPNGGGLWRKNRRDNGDGCFGVDLNRNYSFEFGHDNSCASSNTCSSTYKGPSAFSEPETRAIRDFVDTVQPGTAFSIHSTAGSYLMPYGYNSTPPAFDIYSEWASDFLSENDYPYGTTFLMLGYTSCGTTRDYLHSENIYGWTPEIDGSGFWPAPSEIFNLVDENVYPLFYQAWIAGGFADFQSHSSSGVLVPDSTVTMYIEVKNKGIGDTATNLSVILECAHPDITITSTGTLDDIAPRNRGDASPFQLAVGTSFESSFIEVDIIILQDSVESDRETIILLAGDQNLIFHDDAESGSANWAASGNGNNWSINEDDAYDGIRSFGDSDNGNSQNNTLNYFTLINSIDLSITTAPHLEFYSKWSLEDGDEVLLQASTNSGTNWQTLKSFTSAEPWHQELVSLNNFSSGLFSLRFSLSTDGSIPSDGFYFDNISIIDYDCPSCPVCVLSSSIYPEAESFETGLGLWSQGSDDDLNWTRNTNGTPSNNTGPDNAADGAYYMYIEATSPNFPMKTASLVSPCLNFNSLGVAELNFQYHMYGTADSMQLIVQTSLDAGQTWSGPIWTRTGNQGNQWNQETINLSALTGKYIMLRFYGRTGETWQGDIAIDDIEIQYCPSQLYVNRNIISDGIYRADSSIVSNRLVPFNGHVFFRAGSEVGLNPNFETELGAQFEAMISDCFD